MKHRIDVNESEPGVYKAIGLLNSYKTNKVLSPLLHELIKIRASQINGCSYCIDSHTRAAIELGETTRRLSVLAHWRETDWFDREEQVALDLTEQITLISDRLSQDTYDKAIEVFGEIGFVEIFMAVVSINAWNRLGVVFEMKPR